MPDLHTGLPGFDPELISQARKVAKQHGLKMLKPSGRMSYGLGAYRLEDATGTVVAGRQHNLTPQAVIDYCRGLS